MKKLYVKSDSESSIESESDDDVQYWYIIIDDFADRIGQILLNYSPANNVYLIFIEIIHQEYFDYSISYVSDPPVACHLNN